MKLLLDVNDRVKGYALKYRESENENVIESTDSELNNLIPESVSAENWKEVKRYYKIEGGEIVFDESYSPDGE